MSVAVSLLLVVFFLLMNAFFVVAEFACVRIRKSQIEMAYEAKRTGSRYAKLVAENVNAYLSACQLGITLASLALGWLGEPTVSQILHPVLSNTGMSDQAISATAVAIGFALITALHIIVGELIPKSLAIFSTETYALLTAAPMVWFYRITYPVMVLFNSITNGVMRMLGHDVADEHEVYTDEEIKLLIDESTESGLINPEQNEYVDNIFDLGDKDAVAIMTPRVELICFDIDEPLADAIAVANRHKYTRYPIYKDNKDNIIGFVHIKDLYGLPDDASMHDVKMRTIQAVSESVSLAKLLQVLQAKRTKIALVVDEHGGTSGIVTMSDIMEQILGRLDDEYLHDTPDEIRELEKNHYAIDGTASAEDVYELIGFKPEEAVDCETAGGLIFDIAGEIPQEGNVYVCEHEKAELTFTVVKMDYHRVDKLELRLVPHVKEEGEDSDDGSL